MSKKDLPQLIKVFTRIRPMNDAEKNSTNIVIRTRDQELVIKSAQREKRYTFDKVFREASTQAEIFIVVVAPMIDSIISGINCTLLAYGPTGTGKTHTLTGETIPDAVNFKLDESIGMIPRTAMQLFHTLHNNDRNVVYSVHVSFVEIYNEEVRDLLLESDSERVNMKVYNDLDHKGSVKIINMTEKTALDCHDIFKYLQIGKANRRTACTNLNKESSRSHAVFTITVHTRNANGGADASVRVGKLNFVDLAGSENVARSGVKDARAKEAMNINKSLLTLGKVIQCLSKKQSHIPYRESKLTRILQDSLGGNTKTSMIATISPSIACWEETVSTLEYAVVTRGIENNPQINENEPYSDFLKGLYNEIDILQKELDAARSGQGFYMTKENYQQISEDLKGTKEKNQALTKIETDLIEKIERLNDKIKNVEEINKELNESFEKTRQHKSIIEQQMKEDALILQYLEERDNKVTEMANNLLSVCEMSTKHEEILHNKYKSLIDESFKNADSAKKMYNISCNSLNQINQTISQYSVNQQNKIKITQENFLNIVNWSNSIVNEHKVTGKAIKEILENEHYSLDNYNLTQLFQPCTEHLDSQLYEMKNANVKFIALQNENLIKQNLLEKEIEKLVLLKRTYDVKEEKIQDTCENSKILLMKQMEELNDIMGQINIVRKEKTEILKEIQKKTSEYNELIINGHNSAFEKVKQMDLGLEKNTTELKLALEKCQISCDLVLKNIVTHYEENSEKTLDILKKSFIATDNVCDILNEKIELFNTNLNLISNAQTEFQKKMKFYLHQAKDSMDGINSEICFTTSKGDTPAKKSYLYPRTIEEHIPLQILRKKIKNEFVDNQDN